MEIRLIFDKLKLIPNNIVILIIKVLMNKNAVIGVVLIIIIAIVGIVFMMNSNEDSKDTNNTDTDNTEETSNDSNNSNNNSSDSDDETTNDGTFTTDEVAEHDSASDCWMIIEGKVYDVTEYVPVHPGGAAEISRGCGRDATQLFNTQGGESDGHPARAERMLSEYEIGVLED